MPISIGSNKGLYPFHQFLTGNHPINMINHFVVAEQNNGRDVVDAQIGGKLGIILYVDPFYGQFWHFMDDFPHEIAEYGAAPRPGRCKHHHDQAFVAGL